MDKPNLPQSELISNVPPQNMYIAENVDAMTESKLRLPGGINESRWYSLGSQSTVPFVQFIGSGNVQKIFTWGEMVEVPAGTEVLVKSASLMRGDIIIESGKDIAAKPRRITVPVTMFDQNGDTGPWFDWTGPMAIVPEFPCDARNAHEAYLDIVLSAPLDDDGGIVLTILYDNIIHTYTAQLVVVPVTTHQWAKNEFISPGTYSERIPLGISQHCGNWASEPASLLDKIDVLIQFGGIDPIKGGVVSPTGFWVLNY